MRKNTEVVAAALLQEGRVLATQRGYGPWKGWWELPGGKVDKGESGKEALQRELREELALEARILDRVTTVEYDYPDFHLTMHVYHCLPLGGFTLKEHLATRWLTADELPTVQWLPADLQVLDALAALLKAR